MIDGEPSRNRTCLRVRQLSAAITPDRSPGVDPYMAPQAVGLMQSFMRCLLVWIEAMKYLIVTEQTGTGFSAYSPDLPGCIATGSTRDEVEREMKGAIAFHLDGLKAEGMPIPQPSSSSSYVEIPA